jgi:hypothetical protein
MKKVLLSCLALWSGGLMAQTQVTFTVQIPVGQVLDSVDVTGSWVSDAGLGANWSNGKKLTLGTNNTYSGTVTLPADTIQYKFRTFAGGQPNWEGVPSACANAGGDREMIIGTTAVTAGPYCFSTCNAACSAPLVNVNLVLKVNMAGVDRTLPAGGANSTCGAADLQDTINATGNFGADAGFSDWTPGTILMTPVSPGSSVYTKTITVKNKIYAYKFLRANKWNCDPDTTITGNDVQFSEQKDSFAAPLTCLGGNDRIIDLTTFPAGATVTAEYDWESCSNTPLSLLSQMANRVYYALPNPSNGTTTLHFTNRGNESFNLAVINAMGQVVMRDNNITNDQYTIKNLTTGLYTATLINEKGAKMSFKLSVE